MIGINKLIVYGTIINYYRYETMLRIQKRYSLRFKQSKTSNIRVRGFDMSFSSFPGGIQSGDDFYVISSGLVTLETTIENYNRSLWSNVKPVGQVNDFTSTTSPRLDFKRLCTINPYNKDGKLLKFRDIRI